MKTWLGLLLQDLGKFVGKWFEALRDLDWAIDLADSGACNQ